ncbi:TRAP transporter large permease [Paracoccus aerodenitrificans]|uniref:TRAP transporter large permease n=1 Tax=Paracoccus aerodenitrificans TaxID=3017781 RepID=UPI0022F02B35|nr:TRAP transporter large permease [Paracoccus aerodenitrificans]WBU63599.1 TRAP transporter large permease [Paracoccus aerodenitrificans]
MSLPLIGLTGFIMTLVLIGLGFPVAISMAVIGLAGIALSGALDQAAYVLSTAPFESIFPYSFSVIPLFVLMGVFAAHAGLSRSLFDVINAFVGHWRGGLAVSTVGASAVFGAICGSSLATVATIGRVAMPEMRRYDYDDSLSAAAVAAGGTLGVLIPPSIILVIFGLLTQTSIGALFMGAIIPGILGTVLYALAVMLRVRRRPSLAPAGQRVDWGRRFALLSAVWPVVLLFGLVIGGMQLGWFSPTEAAAVGASGAFLLALVMGGLNRGVMRGIVRETAALTGMIFLILIGAAFFNFFLETTGLPMMLAELIGGSDIHPTLVMILILLFYVVLGCFMDSMSMVLLTVPLLAPVAIAMEYDMVWFGVLVVTVAEIGLITPPVGMNLFVVQATAPGLKQETVIRGILPFITADVLRLALLLIFPWLVWSGL